MPAAPTRRRARGRRARPRRAAGVGGPALRRPRQGAAAAGRARGPRRRRAAGDVDRRERQGPYEAEGIEVFYTLEVTRYFTGRAGRRALRDELRRSVRVLEQDARASSTTRGAWSGVIGPWNWPLLCNYADCVAPLAAGNAVVLKPSEHAPLTSLRVRGAVARGWAARGRVPGRGRARRRRRGAGRVGRHDLLHRQRRTGEQVAQAAATRLIPAVLELGGKSPMIVLADADLPRAARAAVWSSLRPRGQVCIRTERVLVESPVADRFVELCVASAGARAPGDRLPRRAPRGRTRSIDVGAITFQPQVDARRGVNCRRRGAGGAGRGGRRARAPTSARRTSSRRRSSPTSTPDDGGHARRDVRPGAAGHAGGRRGGGAAGRERHAGRAVGQRLVGATSRAPRRWRAGSKRAASLSTTRS